MMDQNVIHNSRRQPNLCETPSLAYTMKRQKQAYKKNIGIIFPFTEVEVTSRCSRDGRFCDLKKIYRLKL